MKTTKPTMRQSTSRTLDDVYNYEKQALDLLNTDHPHYEEVKELLIDQINDEIHEITHTKGTD